MLRIKLIISLLVCSVLMIQAQTVSITGIVKKTGANVGLSGVKVQLAKMTSVSATTDASGAFTLTGTTSVANRAASAASLQFAVKGNVLMFTARSKDVTGSIEIFSGNGKRIVARDIKSQNGTSSLITLPNQGSGVSVMRLVVNGETFVSTLMSVDNNFFVSNVGSGISASGKFTIAQLAKNAATAPPVDTIVASKNGFTTKKLPIVDYLQKDVAIELDSSTDGGVCTRESLKAITDKYIESQKAGDPTKMPLASDVDVLENLKKITLEKSILKTPLKIDTSRSFFDVDSCRTFTEVIAATNSHPYVMIMRLRVKNNQIIEISSMVSDSGDWLFNAKDYLKYSKPQDWHILTKAEQSPRETLISACVGYFEIFNKVYDQVPWGAPCERIEGGTFTNPQNDATDHCKVSAKDMMSGSAIKVTDQDFIVDVEMGTVNGFGKIGGGMPDSHLLRLVNGKLRYVHTLSIN